MRISGEKTSSKGSFLSSLFPALLLLPLILWAQNYYNHHFKSEPRSKLPLSGIMCRFRCLHFHQLSSPNHLALLILNPLLTYFLYGVKCPLTSPHLEGRSPNPANPVQPLFRGHSSRSSKTRRNRFLHDHLNIFEVYEAQ